MSQKKKFTDDITQNDDHTPYVSPQTCHPLLYTKNGMGDRDVDFYTLSIWYPFLRRYCYFGSRKKYQTKRLQSASPSVLGDTSKRSLNASERGIAVEAPSESINVVPSLNDDASDVEEIDSQVHAIKRRKVGASDTCHGSSTNTMDKSGYYADSYDEQSHTVPAAPTRDADTLCLLDWLDPRCSLALCKAQFVHDMGINISMPLHHLCPPLARTQG